MENYLIGKYQEEEDSAEKFIKELENHYIESIKEMDQTKRDNINDIRKSHRTMHDIFQKFKQSLNENDR
jgi:hypothetical protein